MHQTIHHCCLLSKNNSVGLSGSGNKICKGKQQIKIKIFLDCYSPRLLPNHGHLSYPLNFLTINLQATACAKYMVSYSLTRSD
jgi:hypothetical protein